MMSLQCVWAVPLFAVFALAAGAPSAEAIPPLALTLDQNTQSIVPGGTLSFAGILSVPVNSFSPETLYFGGDSLNTLGDWPVGITTDDTPFQTNAPASLAPGAPYSGNLFEVTAAPGTPTGEYSGTFQVEYDDSFGNPFFAMQGFQVIVAPAAAPVPEASTALPFGLLMALGSAAAYRKKSLPRSVSRN